MVQRQASQPFKLADTGSNPVRATKFMTTKQKIEQLEKEVSELKMKVALLEARPMIITVTPQPAIQPWTPSYGLYDGDPVYPTITCGVQSSQNVQAGRPVMSVQNSNFVQ